jgi:alkylmercury lyase
MNAKSVEEIAAVLGRMRASRDRIDGYRPLVVDLVRELSVGVAVTPQRVAELAASRGTPPSTVEEIGRSAEWSDGSIIGLNGLTLGESQHRLNLDNATLGTWCAWDALFLVPIIGRPATLVSTSPATNARVSVTITPEAVTRSRPASAVMSVVVPHADTAATTASDVRATFCHFVHFFEDRSTAEAWVPLERDPAVLDLDDSFRLGQLVYGDLVTI